MILQRVSLSKLSTDRGDWDASKANPVPSVGPEYWWWIRANSWAVRQDVKGHRFMSVFMEDGQTWVPVEVLVFTNEYEDRT
jgi:hypothetical protein